MTNFKTINKFKKWENVKIRQENVKGQVKSLLKKKKKNK